MAHLRPLLAWLGLVENVRKYVAPADAVVILGAAVRVQQWFRGGVCPFLRTAAVVTQLDQVMAPGAQVCVGPRAAYALRGAVVPIGGGYRGGDPTSPRCGKRWALCGAAAITATSPASVRRACGVLWRDVLMGASCSRSRLSTWVCDPMVPCTWLSGCCAAPAGSGAGARVSEPQAVVGCGEWSDSEKGPAGHGGAGGTGQCCSPCCVWGRWWAEHKWCGAAD